MYVYQMVLTGQWSVGFYEPDGTYHEDSVHRSHEDAAQRTHYLNGERRQPEPNDLDMARVDLKAANNEGMIDLATLGTLQAIGHAILGLADEIRAIRKELHEIAECQAIQAAG